MNLLDLVIVIISIWELFADQIQLKAAVSFRSLRIFRTLRVLRVTKLFKAIAFIEVIIKVVSESLSSFFYIAVLLLLFVVIYSLFGVQFFKNNLNFPNRASRSNFDTISQSLISIFQVLTLEG